MKVGLVESLNARPLTWGIEKDSSIEKIYSSPKILSEMLLLGELDTALISSVEILRNQDKLGFSPTCGVCANQFVRSILFFQNRKLVPPSDIWVDSGSRSSVALLELLHAMEYGSSPNMVPKSPTEIQNEIFQARGSHLLFGDSALKAQWNPKEYLAIDLAEWWYNTTGTYFIFALWAYPRNRPISDDFFLESLRKGLASISEILETEIARGNLLRSKAFMETYLRQDLQFHPERLHWKGLQLFERERKARNLP